LLDLPAQGVCVGARPEADVEHDGVVEPEERVDAAVVRKRRLDGRTAPPSGW